MKGEERKPNFVIHAVCVRGFRGLLNHDYFGFVAWLDAELPRSGDIWPDHSVIKIETRRGLSYSKLHHTSKMVSIY